MPLRPRRTRPRPESTTLPFRGLFIGAGLLACGCLAVALGASWYGGALRLAGQSEQRVPLDILIGDDHLRLPANMIRFEDQRRAGMAERVDLYLAWPELEGYSAALRSRFDAPDDQGRLIFVQLSQSTMSRDMSGRVEPIYRHLLEGPARPGPAGLTAQTLKKTSGFGEDVLLTGTDADGALYAVRCALPVAPGKTTNADCQRDVHVGRDLTMLYRFSSQLLPQWQAIDAGLRRFVSASLISDMSQNDSGDALRP
ncbi:hypothetical protein BJF92_22625 [Rhizobium rhizosphaerae]|uniref:Transmembrane anchored protein n=1 Tax=Xaviernesmea rhizosphaerae TaxID=1672749 RepID=A0A1Q9AJC9_9HYPH|nr:hypothetical protein [Xaviernesmea rhizosphaerae]OLP55355.1 hypothetical protein BJF92_22625 [Xaviernesmea rhizosphaerae]